MTIDDTSLAADSNHLALWPPRLKTATNQSIQSKTLCQVPSANETILFSRTTILVNKWNHTNNNPHLTTIYAFKFHRDTSFGQDDKFLRRKDTVLLLLLAIASTCAFHVWLSAIYAKAQVFRLVGALKRLVMDLVGSVNSFNCGRWITSASHAPTSEVGLSFCNAEMLLV